MNFYKKVAYMFLWSILGVIIFMLVTWAVFWVNGNNLIQDRLSDLVLIASEENCLSNDAAGRGIPTGLTMYEDLLEASETDWLKFNTTQDTGVTMNDDDFAYFVGDRNNPNNRYYSYIDAPQKGSIIKVKVTGVLFLPILVNPRGDMPIQIEVPITKEYVTIGLKFFKDK